MTQAYITGIGHYLPPRVVENDDLPATLETNDEWIRKRTGIERRHYADAGVATSDLALEAAKAGPAKEYFPESKKDEVLAHTKLLGPGESETIYFTAPVKGVYDYVCTFPGHFALMKGKMTVK